MKAVTDKISRLSEPFQRLQGRAQQNDLLDLRFILASHDQSTLELFVETLLEGNVYFFMSLMAYPRTSSKMRSDNRWEVQPSDLSTKKKPVEGGRRSFGEFG
jgi:hypothetical protein